MLWNFDRKVQRVSEISSDTYSGILSAEGGWWRRVGRSGTSYCIDRW